MSGRETLVELSCTELSWPRLAVLGGIREENKHFVARRSSFVLVPGDPRPRHRPGERGHRQGCGARLMSKGASLAVHWSHCLRLFTFHYHLTYQRDWE